MNKYKKLSIDTIIFGISTFSSKFLIFFLLPLYTSFLSTEEYGIIDLLNSIVNLLYPILSMSIAEALLRFAFESDIKHNEMLSILVVIIFINISVLIIVGPILKFFNFNVNKYWGMFILLYLGFAFQNSLSYYCRGINKTKIFGIQGIIQTFVTLVLNILLLVLNMKIYGYLIATISGYFVSSIYMFFSTDIYKEILKFNINKNLCKKMLKYSIPMIPTMVAWWINNFADKYFIIILVGMGASGVYSVAHKLPSLITVITSVFNNAWQISAISSNKDKDKINFYSNVLNFFIIISCFCGNIISGLSNIICKFLFAKEYYYGWIFVPILVCASIFASISSFLASIYRAEKQTNILFVSTVIGAIVNVILNYYFINLFGTIGAAYTTLISFIIVLIIRYFYCLRIVKFKLNYFEIIINFIILVITSLYYSIIGKNNIFVLILSSILLIIANIKFLVLVLKKLKSCIKNLYKKSRKYKSF